MNPLEHGRSGAGTIAREAAPNSLVEAIDRRRPCRAQGATGPSIRRPPHVSALRATSVTTVKKSISWRDAHGSIQDPAHEGEAGSGGSAPATPKRRKKYGDYWRIKRAEVREKLLQHNSRFSRNPDLVYPPNATPTLNELAAWLRNLGRSD